MSKNEISQVWFQSVSVALGALLVGCFDVTISNLSDAGALDGAGGSRAIVAALLIDDFEDGNRVPSDLQFGPWRCYTYGDTDTPSPTCGITSPGNMSQYGFFVNFELVDALNHKLDYPIVSLTSQTVTAFDASQYRNIVFSVMLVPQDQPLPKPVYVKVNLTCSTVSDQPEPAGGVFEISLGAYLSEPTDAWQTFALDLSKFIQIPWAKQQMAIDRDLCLKRIDGIQINYQLEYGIGDASVDGQSVTGTMKIDQVYFQ